MKTHYVYRLTDMFPTDSRIYYIGKHSGKIDDLETGRYSTSSKELKNMIIPERFKIKIVKIFNTAREAVMFESKYHRRINARANDKFYNLSNQPYSGRFDRTGLVSVIEICSNNRKTITMDEFRDNNAKYISLSSLNVLCKDKITGKAYNVPKEEFYENENLVGVNEGILRCINKITGEKVVVSKEEYNSNKELYYFAIAKRISAYDTIVNKKVSIEKEEFTNPRYVGIKAFTKERKIKCDICELDISASNFERHVKRHQHRIIWITDNLNINTFKTTEYDFYLKYKFTHYKVEKNIRFDIWFYQRY